MREQLRDILRTLLAAAAALCLACAGACHADIVTLKSGSVLRGEVIREDDETVTLRVTYGTIHIRREQVKSVEKEDGLKTFLDEAKAQEDANNPEGAIRALEKALARFPDSAAVRSRLVALYRRQAEAATVRGDASGVRMACRRLLELAPEDEQASTWLKQAAEAGKDGGDRMKEARLLLSLERCREALDRFQELISEGATSRDELKDELAEAHIGYGRRLLESGRFKTAREQYAKGVALKPELFERYRHEIVVSKLSPIVDEINRKGNDIPASRWEAMAPELEAIVALEKDNVQSRYALGVAYTHMKRYNDAANVFGELVGEAPDLDNIEDSLNALIKKAEAKVKASPIPLVFQQDRFTKVKPGGEQILETRHFVIHHHNDELALLTARGAEYYFERNYRAILGEVPEKPWAKKCDIYLFPSREEYLKRSRQASWSPAMAGSSAIAGRLAEHHIMTYQQVDDLLSSHLSHEITHIIHSAVTEYSGRIPTWFREGLALKMEPWYKQLRMAKVMQEARAANQVFSLDELTRQQGYPAEDRVDLFYSQSYALTNAIYRSGTREQFLRFCHEILDKDIISTWQSIYGLDREELQRRWEAHEADLISLLTAP